MEWQSRTHSASRTDDYLFNQLIPYLGNKRKLLGLIGAALDAIGADPAATDFVDLFAGTGVVSRFAKLRGFRVIANDWEPYSEAINRCHIQTACAPHYFGGRQSYAEVLRSLNTLPPISGWVTQHLCPDDDADYDVARDRLFYMRKNGMRIDAIRARIAQWDRAGDLSAEQKACLLAPLLYSCCYNANTSGLFKGFHKGWGGQTGTALYRIAADLVLRPACFLKDAQDHRVLRADAQAVAPQLQACMRPGAIIYLDPPYNQHPYGANYHVLNSVALWDQPPIPPKITGRGDKSAIRRDWRQERRSPYNHRDQAGAAYAHLLRSLPARWLITSYSTDGFIPLPVLVEANRAVGDVSVFARGYKRYRVSSQRRSAKPMNVEFVLLTEIGRMAARSTDAILRVIRDAEAVSAAA